MKYAFVTGGAGGIAGAIVEALDKTGEWTIFATYHSKPLTELQARCSNRVIGVQLDITSQESCDKAAETVKGYTDTLDALLNFAGIHTMASLVEGDPVAIMERMINTNVLGMIRVTKSFFQAGLLKGKKSRVINCSSECGWMQPQPFNSPYAITKWAVEAYTIGLRRELAFLDIPVVKVQPGSFKSGMHGQATSGYEKLLAETTHYKPVLSVLSPLMTMAMKNPHDMKYIVATTMEALNAKSPKINYRSKNTWYLALIDPIPGKIMDIGYKYVVGGGYKAMKALGMIKD